MKIAFFVTIVDNLDFNQILQKLDFSRDFLKISIFAKIFKKHRFWPKFSKLSILAKILKKSSILVKSLQNLDSGQNFQESRFRPKFIKKTSF